jgi:hypothetical protein
VVGMQQSKSCDSQIKKNKNRKKKPPQKKHKEKKKRVDRFIERN